MFAIISNGLIALLVPAGTAFEWDGLQYAQNWCNLSSPEEKAAIGMVDVVYAPRPDDKYYWVSEAAPVVKDGAVSVEYTATPKNLTECLKQATSAVSAQAYAILLPSDWMVVKAMETSSNVPAAWSAWRQQIRDQAKDQIDALTACVDIAALAALAPVQWANDPNFIESSV